MTNQPHDITADTGVSAPRNEQDVGTREVWPDIVRIVAVFAVILLHTGVEHFYRLDTRTADWQVCNFYESVMRFGVPAFVMLSGAFLLNPAKDYPLKKLYGKKIARLVAAYLFWSVFYVLADHQLARLFGSGAKLTYSQFFTDVVAGKYHLWFLPMMAGLYVVTPILRHLVENERLTVYFLVLSLLFVFAVNTLDVIPFCHDKVTPNIARLDVELVAGFSGYYVWGCWLTRHELKPAARRGIYLAGLLAVLATVAVNGLTGYRLHRAGEWLFGYLSLNTLLAATAVFVFCRQHFRDVRPGPRTRKLTGLLGKWSFGIYLVHVFVLGYLNYILIRLDVFTFVCAHPLVSIPLTAAVVFLISALFVALLSRIPVLNKYIV